MTYVTILGATENSFVRIRKMEKALDRALTYFTLAAPYMDAFDVLNSYHQTAPPISRNSTRTKGRKFASQKSRANRRKGAVKARGRR